jgi:hypothetical protein
VDRSTLGNPGKFTFCFAEDELGSPWEPLSVERGLPPGASAVSVFAGEGVRGVVDQLSRTPDSLARSFAACLRTVAHPKLVQRWDAMLVISPEHARTFRQAGWSKAQLQQRLRELLTIPGAELVRDADGCAEGLPASQAEGEFEKFARDGLWLVHAGGPAGMFSAIIGGWSGGPGGSRLTTREVRV